MNFQKANFKNTQAALALSKPEKTNQRVNGKHIRHKKKSQNTLAVGCLPVKAVEVDYDQ